MSADMQSSMRPTMPHLKCEVRSFRQRIWEAACRGQLFLIGLFAGIQPLVTAGIVLFSLAVLFQLVTLPVEVNASSRALKMLQSTGILGSDEAKGARSVLTAAAMTYVAALAGSILQLLRLIILAGGRRDD